MMVSKYSTGSWYRAKIDDDDYGDRRLTRFLLHFRRLRKVDRVPSRPTKIEFGHTDRKQQKMKNAARRRRRVVVRRRTGKH